VTWLTWLAKMAFFFGALAAAALCFGAQSYFGGALSAFLAIICVIGGYVGGFIEGHEKGDRRRPVKEEIS